MGNTAFESEDWFSDEENKISLSTQDSGSKKGRVFSAQDSSYKLRSVQSATIALDGYGKAPRFVKKSCASQPAKNESGEGNVLRNTFSQPSRETTRPKSPGTSKSSQVLDIPAFDSKDKRYWYIEFKRQKALNVKLKKRLEQSTTICQNISKISKDISKKVKQLSEILN